MSFNHLDSSGRVHMVDVADKPETVRTASARGFVRLAPETVTALRDGTVPKGDVSAVARIAGIQAVKHTPLLLPLAHPINTHGVNVEIELSDEGVYLSASVRSTGRTGVEMEALTAVSVAALNIVDLVKGIDRTVQITDLRVVHKEGGRSGSWRRPGEPETLTPQRGQA